VNKLNHFTRYNPSPRYHELLDLYRQMHVEGETLLNIAPKKTFPGKSLLPHAERLKILFESHGVKKVLDYGAGKGYQYSKKVRFEKPNKVFPNKVFRGIADYWGVSVTCYDPAYPPYARLPERTFDAVIATDVLEHCPSEDMAWILDEMFSRARKVVYANIPCYPAQKQLPNGENAHTTIRPVDWWWELVNYVAANYPKTAYFFIVTAKMLGEDGEKKFITSYFKKGVKEIGLPGRSMIFINKKKKSQNQAGFFYRHSLRWLWCKN